MAADRGRSVATKPRDYKTQRRKCAWGQNVRPMMPRQRCCDRRCAALLRSAMEHPSKRRARVQAAIRQRIEAVKARRQRRWMAMLPFDVHEAFERCFRDGYKAGYSAGARAGTAKAERWIARKEKEWCQIGA